MAGKQPVTELDARFSSNDATPTGWEEARGQLEDAQVYWLSTVRPDGRPHVTPLLAVWLVRKVVDGLTPEQLTFRVDHQANSIAWLVWHLTRIQDDHVADAARAEQVWTSRGWAERFGLPFGPLATGYGHGADDVAAVRVQSGDLLVGYHDAVHE